MSATTTVGIGELRTHLSHYVERARDGEELLITDHGRPVARLAPLGNDDAHLLGLIAAGIVRPPITSKDDIDKPEPVRASGTVTDLIER